MKKKSLILCITLVAVLAVTTVCVLIGIGVIDLTPHEHTWQEANCTNPKTCPDCGETEGEALGHTWLDATCTAPKTCSLCNATEGNALEHSWSNATCTTSKTCSICNTTEGDALGHNWEAATCTKPKTCTVCNQTDGKANGHNWKAATYTSPKTCKTCGATSGNPLTQSKPTVSFEDSYYKIHPLSINGSTITIGSDRAVLDDLKAHVTLGSNNTYKVALTLKGSVERVKYQKASFQFFVYIYDDNGKQIYKSSIMESTSRYYEGDDVAVYITIYSLPYSKSYTIDIKSY